MCWSVQPSWVWSSPYHQNARAAIWGGGAECLHLYSLVYEILVKLERKMLLPRNGEFL